MAPQHQEHHWASVSSPRPVCQWIGKSCRASHEQCGPCRPRIRASLGLCFFPMPGLQVDRKVLMSNVGPVAPASGASLGLCFFNGSESLAVRPMSNVGPRHWASVSSPCPVCKRIGKSCRAMSNVGPVAPASGASLGLCFFRFATGSKSLAARP